MTQLKCPNDGKPMYLLSYQKRKGKSKGPGYFPTEWHWCEDCKKPVQVKIIISEKGFR